ncbi:ABC transporter permease [Candidatus Magnetaquicoccus inordinatus]|uniref:ABC transporter permease n=1 Tax=Candidatus Magnetaquicoccus inordinatus TaxID=2496818 RepID=UPI00102B52E5|nr:hypothetical protein [Candidatus Magnetaquicoccus inordinatus]
MEKRATRRFIPVWASMGGRAYWRSFICGRFGCVGGGRDFFWLTLLLALVISMALLLVGTRAGLVERFTDAILGTLRPHGVPIWVTAHWENHEGIQSTLLDRLKEFEKRVPGENFALTVHPYRRLADGSPHVRLPVEGIWTSGVPWVGWAVYGNDPLWNLGVAANGDTASVNGQSSAPNQESQEKDLASKGEERDLLLPGAGPSAEEKSRGWQGLPLTVVLSESLFNKQFDYNAYREAIQPLLQKKKLRRLPSKPPHGDLKNALSTIWLKVTVGNREDLLPFNVRWVHHIPSMEKVAFLFPLTTYHALMAAYHFPELRYDPLNMGKGNVEYHRWLSSSSFPKDTLTSYERCIHTAVAATGLTDLPRVREEVCAKPSAAEIRPLKNEAKPLGQGGRTEGSAEVWDTLNHDSNNRLWLPCQRLPRSNAMRGMLCPEETKPNTVITPMFVPWDVTSDGNSLAAVHVYVPDPSRLSRGIQGLLSLRTSDDVRALSIQTMYQDALNRFNLLSDLLTTMVPAYALSFGLFLSALLLAQVGTLIGHRRHHYGILLSRGFTWAGIYAKLIWQMILATSVGGTVAVFVFIPLLRLLLEDGFKGIINHYQDLLPPGYDFEILPLPWQPIMVTLGEVLGAVLVVTLILLFRLPLRWGTAPSDLLHGDGRMMGREKAR